MTSTSGAVNLRGPTHLVRVVLHDAEQVASNRALKNLAFTFGLVLWPLQLFHLTPVEETQRVYGLVQRYELDAGAIAPRLVRYPSQPDFAVNTSNLPAIEHRFGLDVTY